jgi:hypothetical protein
MAKSDRRCVILEFQVHAATHHAGGELHVIEENLILRPKVHIQVFHLGADVVRPWPCCCEPPVAEATRLARPRRPPSTPGPNGGNSTISRSVPPFGGPKPFLAAERSTSQEKSAGPFSVAQMVAEPSPARLVLCDAVGCRSALPFCLMHKGALAIGMHGAPGAGKGYGRRLSRHLTTLP